MLVFDGTGRRELGFVLCGLGITVGVNLRGAVFGFGVREMVGLRGEIANGVSFEDAVGG